jgi:hypothetical protein
MSLLIQLLQWKQWALVTTLERRKARFHGNAEIRAMFPAGRSRGRVTTYSGDGHTFYFVIPLYLQSVLVHSDTATNRKVAGSIPDEVNF